MNTIFEYCLKQYGLRGTDLGRKTHLVYARAITAYMMYKYAGHNKSEIARFLKKDHATILHAIKKVDDYLLNADFKSVFLKVEKFVKRLYVQEYFENITEEEQEIRTLKDILQKLEAENKKLKRLKVLKYPKELVDLCAEMSENELTDFVKYKVEPHKRMLLSDKIRRVRYETIKA